MCFLCIFRWLDYVIWAQMGIQWRRCRGMNEAIKLQLVPTMDTSLFGMYPRIKWLAIFFFYKVLHETNIKLDIHTHMDE